MSVRVAVVRHGRFFSDPRVVKQCLALARDRRFTVEVLARGREEVRWIDHPRLQVTTIRKRPVSDHPAVLAVQAFVFGVFALLRFWRDQPDLVIVHSIPSWLLLLLSPLRARRGTTMLLDHHEPETEMLAEAGLPPLVVRAYRAIESLALRGADGVIDVSPEMSARSKSLGARRQLVVENAPEIFTNSDPTVAAFDLGVFGSLIRRYDLDVLGSALELLEPIDILQVGDGPARLMANPSRGGLVSTVYLPPPQLQAQLKRCRLGFVGLHPSSFTAYISPNRLWELAALEIPMVVAETQLLQRLVGDAAFFYQGGSATSLAEAIKRALSSPQQVRLEMASLVKQRLHERLWEATSARFVEFCSATVRGEESDH